MSEEKRKSIITCLNDEDNRRNMRRNRIEIIIAVLVIVVLFLTTHVAPRGKCILVQGRDHAYHATIYVDLGFIGFGRRYGGGFIYARNSEWVGSHVGCFDDRD